MDHSKGLIVLVLLLSSVAFAGDKVFTDDDLEQYKYPGDEDRASKQQRPSYDVALQGSNDEQLINRLMESLEGQRSSKKVASSTGCTVLNFNTYDYSSSGGDRVHVDKPGWVDVEVNTYKNQCVSYTIQNTSGGSMIEPTITATFASGAVKSERVTCPRMGYGETCSNSICFLGMASPVTSMECRF